MNQAQIAIKPGLRNSDGWIEAKPSDSQRVAPLPKSVPMTGSARTVAKAPRNSSTPRRRTCTGDSMDTTSITPSAMPPKAACRET